jgi:hypothetical protein
VLSEVRQEKIKNWKVKLIKLKGAYNL